MKKLGILLLSAVLVMCVSCGGEVQRPDVPDVPGTDGGNGSGGDYCSKITAAVFFGSLREDDYNRYGKDGSFFSGRDHEKKYIELADGTPKDIILMGEADDYDYIGFAVYFSDFEAGKTVPEYSYKLQTKGGINLGGDSGNSAVIYYKVISIEELKALPSVKVTVNGETVYDEVLSEYNFEDFSRLDYGRDELSSKVWKNVSLYDKGTYTFRDGQKKKKSIFEPSKADELFEFTYDEYMEYLEKAYDILKAERLDEIKEQASYWRLFAVNDDMVIDNDWRSNFYASDSFESPYTRQFAQDVYDEVDSVYSSFETFCEAYFRGYDTDVLKECTFCIPRAVVMDLSSSSFLYRFGYFDGVNNYSVTQEHDPLLSGLFSDYGIFFNYAPGAGSAVAEIEKLREDEGFDRLYTRFNDVRDAYAFDTRGLGERYSWHDIGKIRPVGSFSYDDHYIWYGRGEESERNYDTVTDEKTGGIKFAGGILALTLSSFKYVEVMDGKSLLGKLRNNFFCYVDDGTYLKSLRIAGSKVWNTDAEIDYLDMDSPFFGDCDVVVEDGDGYRIIGNGRYSKAENPHFFVCGTYRNF